MTTAAEMRPGQTWNQGTHLYSEPSPSSAELKESVARLETECLEHVMDFPVLDRFDVFVCRALEQVASDAAFCIATQRAQVSHLLAQSTWDERARCGSADIWPSRTKAMHTLKLV